MKIFNIIIAIIFLLFAAVQFNDSPDDILFWVVVYAGVGIISAFAAYNKYNMWAILLGLAVVVFEMFRKFPTFALWVSDGMPSIILTGRFPFRLMVVWLGLVEDRISWAWYFGLGCCPVCGGLDG